eukprot:UN01011
MSFIGACSGIHAAKQNEKARNDEIPQSINTHHTQTQPHIKPSFNLFQVSFFNRNHGNNQPYFNNMNWSSNPIISSRFQQQKYKPRSVI